ncbi:helix-turn-helix domain-containing protein [Sporosarcina globispora]|uniref:helix-turn-helix domain-containing protein n=1 Tax=Sporosarcina globispora TaxID=1459 RepID=UPI0006A9ED56|nr:helix-turn-helix transcriptional regulator [Sporosarcina globispora]
MTKFKDNLLILRKDKGLTQDDVAQYLQLSRPAYSRYETGGAEPTIENLMLLADLYNISLDELVGRDFKQDSKGLQTILVRKQIDIQLRGILQETIKEIVDEKENEIRDTVLKKFGLQ